MPRQLALLISILVILYLFWMDRNKSDGVSHAIWIPFLWLFLSASRSVSHWLNLGTPDFSADVMIEGNPINRAVFIALIFSAVLILIRRKIYWRGVFTQNAWVWLYFVFGAISFAWSDYPFVSFKRWVKALGNVVMVLVVLTEDRPYVSLGLILRRLSFLLLPLSVLFIKYYPELGRVYHMGRPLFSGVSDSKNGLGVICLLASIYFSWNLLIGRREKKSQEHQIHFSVYLVILPMITWLFYMAKSATSFACMLTAVGLFVLARIPAVAARPGRIMALLIGIIALYGVLEITFDLNNAIIVMLGRRPDLTTRVPMWEDLLSMVRNPLVGYGFESFWLGERLVVIQERWGRLLQAHNGYLEMYLNMGGIGVLFIICWLLSGIINVNRHLLIHQPTAILRLCFICVVALYNYTEATFYGVSNMWMLLLLGVMDPPRHVRATTRKSGEHGCDRMA